MKRFAFAAAAAALAAALFCACAAPGPADAELSPVNLDLTVLSGTVVYAEVYNMLSQPEDYVGKTIRASGPFTTFQNPETGQYYFAVTVQDATACCANGLEFVLADENAVYPDDYPELGEEITVSGELETYEENGYVFCHLTGAVIEQKPSE